VDDDGGDAGPPARAREQGGPRGVRRPPRSRVARFGSTSRAARSWAVYAPLELLQEFIDAVPKAAVHVVRKRILRRREEVRALQRIQDRRGGGGPRRQVDHVAGSC